MLKISSIWPERYFSAVREKGFCTVRSVDLRRRGERTEARQVGVELGIHWKHSDEDFGIYQELHEEIWRSL